MWLLLVIIVFILLIFFYIVSDIIKPKNYPPGPLWLPLIGCSHVLRKYVKSSENVHHLGLEKMREKYKTNVLGLKLGPEKVVVVFSYETVKKILTTQTYEGRPDNFFIRLRSMGTRKGITSADGDFWLIQRRFVVQHLKDLGLGNKKGQINEIMEREVKQILEKIEKDEEKANATPIGQVLAKSVMNILWFLTAGNQIDKRKLDHLLTLLHQRSKAFDMSGGILNQFPWLRHLAPEKTGYNLMKKFNEELYKFFIDIIDEHEITWTEDRTDDLIYSFISQMKREQNLKRSTFTKEQLIMVCSDIFIAGGKSTSTLLDFAFLMMAIYTETQDKIHQELDSYKKDTIDFADKPNLPYMKGVLLEIDRYCHVTPITGPRRTLLDTTLEGYYIPKNTTILISSYSVHREKSYWGDPDRFSPERFLTKEEEIVEQSAERMNKTKEKNVEQHVIPFGLGRRRCFGESLARNFIFTIFANVLNKYKLKIDDDDKGGGSYSNRENNRFFIPGLILTPKPYRLRYIKKNNNQLI